jgi:protein gp37
MLRDTPAQVRFLSLEPLIGPVDAVDFQDIDWVIAGGESGRGARPVKAEWIRDIRDRCAAAGAAFFFKQWGGEYNKRGNDEAILDDRRWTDFPAAVSAV